ncbi:MAG: hypothetical protein PHV13_05775 [Candidatus ainarchaeum sp.]|nr:hypothetical protein [Candidatus ainarchaeum sp.]
MKGTICGVDKTGNAMVTPENGGRTVVLQASAGKGFRTGQSVLYENVWSTESNDLSPKYRLAPGPAALRRK